jgi:23S rRNA (guanosine2251-2'-O)-methyltransferase
MAYWIYGKNTVLTQLTENPARVVRVLIANDAKPDKRIGEIISLCTTHRIEFSKQPFARLTQKLKDILEAEQKKQGHDPETSDEKIHIVHQGILASVAEKPLVDLDDLVSVQTACTPLIVALDDVMDPRNLGAIMRVCDGAGVQGIVLPKHHHAGFGPALSKTACGAEETVDLSVVTNLSQALKQLKDKGYWIVGSTLDSNSQLYTVNDYKMPIVLVLGSEEKGLRPAVQKQCDFLVKLPMLGKLASLNVSCAASVMLYEIRRQQLG